MVKTLLLPATFALAWHGAHAIVIRHDRDDARYRELAGRYKAPVCVIAGDGLGCLVGKRWVVTAAHVGQLTVPLASYVSFGDRYYTIKHVWLHPDFSSKKEREKTDLALIELNEDVQGIHPVGLYEASDEVGKKVELVGWGNTGTGLTGDNVEDWIWRGAENIVDSALPNFVRIKFDAPPEGLDLEGISGSGDSGMPLLYERDGKLWVFGVGSDNAGDDGDTVRGGGSCKYGTYDYFTRVSTAMPWIRGVMRNRKGYMDSWKPAVGVAKGWPTPGLSPSVHLWIDLLNSGDASKLVDFAREHYAPEVLADLKAEDLLATAKWRIKTFGKLEPSFISLEKNGSAVSILAYSTAQRATYLMQFIPYRGEPTKIAAIVHRKLPYLEEKYRRSKG